MVLRGIWWETILAAEWQWKEAHHKKVTIPFFSLACGFPHIEITWKLQPSIKEERLFLVNSQGLALLHPHSLDLFETNSTYSDGGWLTLTVSLLCWNPAKPLRSQLWDLSFISSHSGLSRYCYRTSTMISCLYPELIGAKALEWALGGHEFPLGLGTISSGIFLGTDLSLPFISNHRRRLGWKPEATRWFQVMLSYFLSSGVNCSPQTWGHCRIQNCIKECQVVFSLLPGKIILILVLFIPS